MKISYDILFQVTVKHTYYNEQKDLCPDFDIEPTATTKDRMKRYGLIFRPNAHGFWVLARIDPQSSPVEIFSPIDEQDRRFTFVMKLKNPHFLNYTAFPNKKPPQLGRELYYFSNLKMDENIDFPQLADKVSTGNQQYLRLLGKPVFNLVYPNKVNSSSPLLIDLFGNEYHPSPVLQLMPGQLTDELQFNFSKIRKVQPSRYQIKDSNLAAPDFAMHLFYEPGIQGPDTFGVIDIFNSSLPFSNNPPDGVALKYRFLDGKKLIQDVNGQANNYTVNFQAGSYVLEYLVHYLKIEPPAPPPPLPAVAPVYDITNTSGTSQGFTSATLVANGKTTQRFKSALLSWQENPRDFVLRRTNNTPENIKYLPNPTVMHPQKRDDQGTPQDTSDDILFYELKVYV